MKAIKLSVNVFVLMGLVAVLTAIPATAQSQWDFAWSAALGLAENGFLVVVAPPAFTGCTSGSTLEWLEGELPNVYVYSLFVPDDLDAPTWTLHWVATPPGRYNASWVADAWIRVFELQDGDLEWFYSDPCGFYSNSIHPYIAGGLGRLNLHSPDDLLEGPGANSWGWYCKETSMTMGTARPGRIRVSSGSRIGSPSRTISLRRRPRRRRVRR